MSLAPHTGALPPDTRAVLALVAGLDHHPLAAVREALPAAGDLVVARAPGRLDVMGGIADYSGSLVLQLPIREAAHVALGADVAPVIAVVSVAADGASARTFAMPTADLERLARAPGYDEARAYFRRDPAGAWAGYVLGAFVVLARERGLALDSGARLLVVSEVPEGKGVSSSAAVEVASMAAIASAFGVPLAPRELALLCQRVENLVVGAPCGVMDQMTAACGEADRLLALVCQPAELEGTIPVPGELAFWGIDSGVRHAVVGDDYATVRTAAFMGYRMIADAAGRASAPAGDGRMSVRDDVWRGYLANVDPDEYRAAYARLLPESLGGAEFLERYGGTTDPVTRVAGDRVYPVRAATAHPIFERARVDAFRRLLVAPDAAARAADLGALMYASHASYSACGLGSEATDLLVDLVRAAGPARGLFGAKITGGGSGGTVAILGRAGAGDAVEEVAREYGARTGRAPHVFSGSSAGAAAFGYVRVARAERGHST